MTPRFSIIIPVYNVAPYLRECLDSVQAQAFADWEAICVDDGSSDASSSILDEYAAGDSRIMVIHQKNYGVAVARNRGLVAASGEWVLFLDADDYWASDLLEEMARVAGREDSDWVRFGFTRVADSGRRQSPSVQPGGKCDIVEGVPSVRHWAVENLTVGGYCCCNLIRRSKILANFPVGVKYGEDALFLLQVAYGVKKIVISDYAGYYYRDTPGSAMKRKFSSAERLEFFKTFENVVAIYGGRHTKFSWMGWFNLVNFALRGKDCEKRIEIYSKFKQLVAGGSVCVADLPYYAKLCFMFYVKTGWHWPICVTYRMVMGLSRMRDCVLRMLRS